MGNKRDAPPLTWRLIRVCQGRPRRGSSNELARSRWLKVTAFLRKPGPPTISPSLPRESLGTPATLSELACASLVFECLALGRCADSDLRYERRCQRRRDPRCASGTHPNRAPFCRPPTTPGSDTAKRSPTAGIVELPNWVRHLLPVELT